MGLHEPSRRSDWLVIGAAVAGIALFFLDQLTIEEMWGNILRILSGLACALLAILLRKERGGSPMQVVLLGDILTALIGLPFAFSAGMPDSRTWFVLITLDVVELGQPYVLYAVAIRRVTALGATVITLLEPVLNPIWVMLAVGDQPGRWAAIGGGLVLAAVLVRGLSGALKSRTFRKRQESSGTKGASAGRRSVVM